MKLRAALLALLVSTCALFARAAQVRAAGLPDREAAIRQHQQYSEQSRLEWIRRPGEWRPAFAHAHRLCKLREQQCLRATRGQIAQGETPGDSTLGELAEALGDALHGAATPQERRLTVNLYQRVFGEAPPGVAVSLQDPAASSSSVLAYW